MSQALHALAFVRLWLATAGNQEAPAPAKPRRKLKAKRSAYRGPARLDANRPILAQLASGLK